MYWWMMSQQSQQSGVAAIIVKLTEIKFTYRRIDEAHSESADDRIRTAFLDQGQQVI